ncbi:uncharacterized, partial [Tachysurus ichikawai]
VKDLQCPLRVSQVVRDCESLPQLHLLLHL